MGGDEPINLRICPVKHNHYLQLSHDRMCVDWFYICIIRIAERALSHTVHETCMYVTRAHRPVHPFLVSVRQGNVGKDSFFIEVVADFLFSFNEEVFFRARKHLVSHDNVRSPFLPHASLLYHLVLHNLKLISHNIIWYIVNGGHFSHIIFAITVQKCRKRTTGTVQYINERSYFVKW